MSATIIAIPVLIVIGLYNSMIKLRNNRENAFADIDVQLRQRHDLIPQLMETVCGYAKHESTTLQAVVEARNGNLY
jgi:LemA protein